MEYGICTLAVVPMRAGPNERSEQVSQLLFGEAYQILEWTQHWVRIRTAYDKYEGWIGRLQVEMLSYSGYRRLTEEPAQLLTRPVTQAWKLSDNSVLYLPATSSLAFLQGTTCVINNESYSVLGEAFCDVQNVTATAKSYLNTPYLWGGRTHFGIDCSGFTQAVMSLHGVGLLRDASQQATQGTVVSTANSIQPGDLAFFTNPEGRITHVGILLGPDKIIHASGRVKIDSFDSQGIYSDELKRYTHQFSSIKRFEMTR